MYISTTFYPTHLIFLIWKFFPDCGWKPPVFCWFPWLEKVFKIFPGRWEPWYIRNVPIMSAWLILIPLITQSMELIKDDFTFALTTTGIRPRPYGLTTSCSSWPYPFDATMTINLTGTVFHIEESVSSDVKIWYKLLKPTFHGHEASRNGNCIAWNWSIPWTPQMLTDYFHLAEGCAPPKKILKNRTTPVSN